ncbi:MAG: hypothetical protein C4518_18495 [Desulfobacteraceae bacterium]|nr:MAG: hypothetical protein C4518_18495 [Desulfobacteraceae bacterium]
MKTPKYIDKVRNGELSIETVDNILKHISKYLVMIEMPSDILNLENKLTYHLTSLPIYIVKGHNSWSGIVICFPGKKEDLKTENISTPYIRSILYPMLELSRRVKESEKGRFECIYIVGEYVSEVLLRKFRLLKAITPNLIVLSKNIIPLADSTFAIPTPGKGKMNEDFVQKTLCAKMIVPEGLFIPTRTGDIRLGYIKHEMKAKDGTKEPEKLDILCYDKDNGSLIAFEIKGPACSRVELENLFLQGIEHQMWVEENKRAIKLFHEGPRGKAINSRKRVKLLLGFFGDIVPPLFHDLRDQAEHEDRHLKIEFVRFYFDMFDGLFISRFPEPETVSCLMTLKPQQWGLRGDPYLWEEMFNHLATTKLPDSISGLIEIIEQAFIELTAHPITYGDNIYLEKYSHGGMSSGYIEPRFWGKTVLPLVVERYEKFFRK